MSNESYFALRQMRPRWLLPLLLSVPTYVRRFFFVAVLVPCGLPLSLVFVANTGSITATTQTVLRMAAASGVDPDAITIPTCDDEVTRSGEARFRPHICSHFRTDSVPVVKLAADNAVWLRALYGITVIVTWIVSAPFWRRTPLSLFLQRSLDRAAAASEHSSSETKLGDKSRVNGEGDTK
ncbi:hypothetical protein [Burkholderia contaminans]|uniref:hypothetical protein n=1 Tax=Burkholderia contaminans TaxID=488447 RepID=UPI000F5A4EF8|nr:hypothetical protein [Burkholderia contaminans]